MSRHFHVQTILHVGDRVALDAGRFVRVLRKGRGDAFFLCDAAGILFRVVLTSTDPCEADVTEQVPDPGRDAQRELAVWFPLLKGGRSDDLVRQLTELGVTHLVPFQSQYSVVQLDPRKARDREDRFRTIASEAANQCGRLRVPNVLPLARDLPHEGPGVFFWEVGGRDIADLPAIIAEAPQPSRWGVLFGPEGGLSSAEAERLGAAGWTAMSLGPRILRAETAVVVGTTLVQAAFGALAG